MIAMMVPTQPSALRPVRKNCGPGLPGMYSVSHLQTTVMTNTFSQRTLRAEGGAGDHRKKLLMLSLGLLTEYRFVVLCRIHGGVILSSHACPGWTFSSCPQHVQRTSHTKAGDMLIHLDN